MTSGDLLKPSSGTDMGTYRMLVKLYLASVLAQYFDLLPNPTNYSTPRWGITVSCKYDAS